MLESILGGANVIGNISFGVRGCIFFLLDTTLWYFWCSRKMLKVPVVGRSFFEMEYAG